MHRYLILLLLAPGLSFAVNKKNTVKDCQAISKGECLTFKGRARFYTGNTSTRIWKVGTNRMLAVTRQTENVFSDLNQISFATQLFAEFDACYLKPELPSGIQEICVYDMRDKKLTAMPE